MITGALLIDYNKRYDIKTYFSKRFYKTVIPYLFWSFVMTIALAYANHPIDFIGHVFDKISIYWFFIPLFGIYLSIPAFSAINDEKKKNIFTYVVLIAFVINIMIPFLISVLKLNIHFSLEIVLASNYLYYPLVGWLLHNYELKKNQRIIIYLLALIGFAMMFFGTYFLSMSAGSIIDTYKGYENLPCVLYSIGTFVFIKYELNKTMKNTNVNKIITLLSSYTLGVYLIHMFVKDSLIRIFSINISSTYYLIYFPFICFFISVLMIYIMRKIPLLNKLVP